jgi:hypothetical protein
MESKERLAGICGIFCGDCPKYLAPRLGDRETMEVIGRETGFNPEDQVCDGCLSDRVALECRDCKHGFRDCAAERGVTWCFECAEFPCSRLEEFKEIHVVNGISHHRFVVEELRFMKDNGVGPWVDRKTRASLCPECGRGVYWHSLACPSCSTPVR